MIFCKNGVENGLYFRLYCNGAWYAKVTNNFGLALTLELPKDVQSYPSAEMWVLRYLRLHYPDERCLLTWVINQDAKNNGLSVMLYLKGNTWYAEAKYDGMVYVKIPLNHKICTFTLAITWAFAFANGQYCELIIV